MTKQRNDYGALTAAEVQQSRAAHGENVLTPPRRTSLWHLYMEKYQDPIIQILLVAAAVSLVLAIVENEYIETIGIFVAIFLATTIGFYFERDAARKFDVLTALGEEQPVKVYRRNAAGETMLRQVARREVVVGDVVLVETGDEIPADGLLLQSRDLQVNESSLTGEMTAEKYTAPPADHGAAYAPDQLLRSTMVMSGHGICRVTAVGDETEIGKVARSSTEDTAVKTPLSLQLDRLARIISRAGMSISVLAFVFFLLHDVLTNDAVWHGDSYLRMAEVVLKYFMMAVTLIVMAVPEGLPMAITLSLALNMRRMLKSNNLVRKLHACETMGAVTVICTDKTGTLTQNRMSVQAVQTEADRRQFYQAIAVNTTAHLAADGQGIGNPTEAALLQWMQAQGEDYRKWRNAATVAQQLPFTTERKYMQTTALVDGEQHVYTKGAPEIILKQCRLDAAERQRAEQQLRQWQQQAMRTLAFARDGRLQAIVAISDPIRPDVPEAVNQCRQAGIDVKIVTGDTSATAIEIGRQIGIMPQAAAADAAPLHISGPDFAAMTDEEASSVVKNLPIISRARPQDKQRLVELLQQGGEVVAVTGDGTNDAPALHHAHVGLSLGSSTSVAKEASDITLLDDSFRSIVSAVMWGRSLYKNIQRFLFFQLVVNVAALLLVLGGAVIGTEMPLTVTQILWVNLIMDTFAAMALASLPPSREVLNDKPRRQTDFIITRSMWAGILGIGGSFFVVMFALLVYCLYFDSDPGVQQRDLTVFFTTFVMLQFWNLFNAKTLGSCHSAFRHLHRDKGLLLVLALVLAGQWMIVMWGGRMFRTVPLSWCEWGLIVGCTSVVMWLGELWRWWARRKKDNISNNIQA